MMRLFPGTDPVVADFDATGQPHGCRHGQGRGDLTHAFRHSAGGEARLHLDEASAEGQYRANPNSVPESSPAAKSISVMRKADGFAPLSAEIAKDKAGPEEAD
jgi:hypothetical protein